jgi:hypothetical protein
VTQRKFLNNRTSKVSSDKYNIVVSEVVMDERVEIVSMGHNIMKAIRANIGVSKTT